MRDASTTDSDPVALAPSEPWPAGVPVWLAATGAVGLLLVAAAMRSDVLAVAASGLLAASLVLLSPLEPALVIAVVWLTLQNFVLPLVFSSDVFLLETIRSCLALKELMLGLLLARLLWIRQRPRLGTADVCLLVLAADAVLGLAVPNGVELRAKLVALRGLIIPILFYFVGRLYAFGEDAARRTARFLRVVGVIGIVVAASGLLSHYTLGLDFWREIRAGQYWTEVKGLPDYFTVNDLPGNFFRDDDEAKSRLVSFPGDPLATAYFLFFSAMVLALYVSRKDRPRWAWIAGGGVVLWAIVATGTRAAMLAFVVSLPLLSYRLKGRGWATVAVCATSAAALLAIPQIRELLVSAVEISDASSIGHVLYLVQAFTRLAAFTPVEVVFGSGMGFAGATVSASDESLGVLENIYLVVYAQLGLAGTLLFLGAIVALFRMRGRACARELAMAKAVLLGYLLTGLISEQLTTATSTGPFWLALGMLGSWCGVEGERQEGRTR